MPRKTKAQIEQLLAALHAARSDRNKAQKLVDQYEAEIAAIPSLREGTYGAWVYALTEGRRIDDREELKAIVAATGREWPTRLSKPSIVAKPVTK